MKCASALLLMDARTDVRNAAELTAADLCLALLHTPLRRVFLDAWVHHTHTCCISN